MDLKTLLQHVASAHSWPMVADSDGDFRLEIATTQGRSQVVQITPSHDPDGRPLCWIWSTVCDVSAVGDPWFLLRKNADLAYGALAVRGQNVLLVETQLIETADYEETARAIFYVASEADALEEQAYGKLVDQR